MNTATSTPAPSRPAPTSSGPSATTPSTMAPTPTTPGARPTRRVTAAGRALRAGQATILAAAATALVVGWSRLIPTETSWTAKLLRHVFGGGTGAAGDTVWTGIGTPAMLGMRLTTQCSTTVLLVPLCLLGAALTVGLRRSPAWRIALGVAAALAVAVAANQLRLALLVVLWRWQGQGGFDLGHRYLGSVEVIVLFGVSMYFMVRVATGGRRTGARVAAEPVG